MTELAKKLDQTIRRNMGNEMINMFARKDQCLELVDRAEISLDHPFELLVIFDDKLWTIKLLRPGA